MELSSQHAQLLDSYVRMVGQRTRQLHVKEFELAIEEFTESQVPQGELLNEEEIKSLVSDLKSEVVEVAEKEVDNAYQIGIAMVTQLLQAADAQQARLFTDVSALASDSLVKGAASMQQSLRGTLAARGLAPIASTRLGALPGMPSFGPQPPPDHNSAGTSSTPGAGDTAALTQKAKDAELRALAAMRDKTALNEEVDQLRQQVEQLQADNTKMAAAHSSALQIDELTAHNLKLTSEAKELKIQLRLAGSEATAASEEAKARILEAAKAEEGFNQALSESRQVAQLKSMLKAKSQEVVDLRKRLRKDSGLQDPDEGDT